MCEHAAKQATGQCCIAALEVIHQEKNEKKDPNLERTDVTCRGSRGDVVFGFLFKGLGRLLHMFHMEKWRTKKPDTSEAISIYISTQEIQP